MNIIEQLSDKTLENIWYKYDWKEASNNLFLLQSKLVQSVRDGEKYRTREIFDEIVNSIDAKMLAVKAVCDGKYRPGIDGIKWTNAKDKVIAAHGLDSETYEAKPYKRVIIECRGKKRNIDIPTYRDRAMQKLYYFALSPLSEAIGERKSFGFRKERANQDAILYAKEAILSIGYDGYVILADVKGCYENISQKWLMDHIPMNKHVLREFLNAGYVLAGNFFATDETGIPLGSSISHIIGNMTLDGMQKHLYHELYTDNEIDYANGNLIRFADDILITAKSLEDANRMLEYISNFLCERGLTLSTKKTKIVKISNGFQFLNMSFTYVDTILSVRPCDEKIDEILSSLQELIMSHRGSQSSLIEKINSKLRGYAAYYRAFDSEDAFKKIDYSIKGYLLDYCKMKHPTFTTERILEKYWYRESNSEYVFAMPDYPEMRVNSLVDTKMISHLKVLTNKNPYIDTEYFESRSHTNEIQHVNGDYKFIWNRQGGKCHLCGKEILKDQAKSLITIDPSQASTKANMAYVHSSCIPYEFEYIHTSKMPASNTELMSVLNNLPGAKPRQQYKYAALSEYFSEHAESKLTLSFAEIENIMGKPLSPSAYTSSVFWHHGRAISRTWVSNGYRCTKIDMENQKIVLKLISKKSNTIDIPQYLTKPLPEDAIHELEAFFEHIKKKYAL